MFFFNSEFKKIIDTSFNYVGTNNQFINLKDSLNQTISYSLIFKRFFKNSSNIDIRKHGGYYILNNNNLYGVIDSNYKEVLPFKYNSINYFNNNFYASINSGTALFDENLKLIIPSIYERLIKTKFGFIYYKNNLCGVLNKNGKKITEARFRNIDINSIPIKCYLPKEGVVQLIFDDKWNFVSKKEFKKLLILNSKWTPTASALIEPNINQFGWFKDTIIATKKDGSKVKVVKWGLKNDIDTIITPPIYREYEIINDSISYGYRGKKLLTSSKKRIKGIPVGASYNVVNHITGERVLKQPIYKFFITDFENNNLARALTYKGIYIYNKNFTPILKNIHYANAPQEGMLLYSEYNKDKRDKSNIEGQIDKLIAWQEYATGISLSKEASSEYYKLLRARVNIKPYITPHIKFGYLNSITQQEAFPTQFDRATNFYQGVAFVGVKNKKTEKIDYGIIRKDSIIVPLKFDKVNFLYPNTYDSLYIVTKNNGKQLFFDSLLNPKPIELKNMTRVEKDVIIATQNNKTGIVNDDLQWELEPTYRRIIISKNNALISKNKLHGAITSEGESLFEPTIKKKHIIPLKYGAKLYQNRNQSGKVGYYHYQYGELFKPTKGKVYESEQTTLKLEHGTPYYYKNGQELKTNKLFKYTLIMENDSISISKRRKKIKILNKNTEEKIKIKGFVPNDLTFEGIYHIKGSSMGLTNYKGQEKIKAFMNSKLTPLNDSILLTENIHSKFKDKRYGLVNIEGKQLRANEYLKIEEVFDGIYFCFSKRNISVFVNKKGDTLKTVKCNDFKSTSDGLLLLIGKENIIHSEGSLYLKGKYNAVFLDSTLSNPFAYKFIDAKQFVNGIATVRSRKGWQVMNRNGELISIPSFYSMEPIANNTIVAKEKPKHGVYNYEGKVIVPVEFEEINTVSPTIIQVIKEGKAGYVSTNGNWIYNPF